MFKKVLLTSAVLVAGLGFTACSSDDDNNTTPNPLLGDWKAQTVSYVRPDTGETMTHDFAMITNGCDVDELELKADNIADLETESKIDGVCVEAHAPGTWNENSVTILGETAPRQIVSVSGTELLLKYMMTYQFGTTEVTVKYSRS